MQKKVNARYFTLQSLESDIKVIITTIRVPEVSFGSDSIFLLVLRRGKSMFLNEL